MPSLKQKQITVKQFNHLCGVSAARGTFYDRYKAAQKSAK